MTGSTQVPRLSLRSRVDLPRYARGAPGVVHLGLGAFHRAHQALVFDALLSRGDTRWGVMGIAMRSAALADALAAQDELYSVQIASAQGVAWQIPGAMWATAVAEREREKVVAALAAASTRWVTLTVTEKGYAPPLAGLLIDGLLARHALGLPGLTIASCDNLTDNGRRLQALCKNEACARKLLRAFVSWLSDACAFPNSMVDRIVPAATPAHRQAALQALGVDDACALGTEAFWEWVIERRFVDASDAAALQAVGVTIVDAVRPFEEAKLRMLNGSHTAMACIGAVAGLPFIADCVAVPALRRFIFDLMTEEVGPHLLRADWPAYRDALIARFENPALRHSVHQIATDCSLKIPLRWVPGVEQRIAAQASFSRFAFAAATWMRYARGVDDQGKAYGLNDPLSARVHAAARAHVGDPAATVHALGHIPEIWGTVLPTHAPWLAAVTLALQRIERHGMLAALAQEPHPL
jgi:fructuronate reductase